MITVEPATASDVLSIAVLLQEVEAFYGGSPVDDARLPAEQAAIAKLLFGPSPAAHVLLARDGDDVAGLASYSFLWPAAGITKSLFLKELFIRDGYRRSGVGRFLMESINAIAAAEQCSRVEWMTERDNDEARQFYEALGFCDDSSKLFFRRALG